MTKFRKFIDDAWIFGCTVVLSMGCASFAILFILSIGVILYSFKLALAIDLLPGIDMVPHD